MPQVRAQLAVELLDPDEDVSHLRDRVDTEVRPRTVRGPTSRLHVEPDDPAVCDRDPELVRRGDDGGVRADAAARAEGRGAYVCVRPECAQKLTAGRPLERAFRAPVKLDQETIDLVCEWQRSAFTR